MSSILIILTISGIILLLCLGLLVKWLMFYFSQERKLILEARELFQKQDYKTALEKFKEVIKLNPKIPEAYFASSKIYLQQEEYDNAIHNLIQLAKLQKKAPILNELGWAYHLKGDLIKAEECYKQAINKDKKFSQAYINLAGIYMIMENYNEAIQKFNEVIENEPNNPLPYKGLAEVYLKIKEFEKVITNCDIWLSYDPDNVYAYYHKAVALYFLKENEKFARLKEKIELMSPKAIENLNRFIEIQKEKHSN